MRRTLHIITATLGLVGCSSVLARGQEADLLPALLALDTQLADNPENVARLEAAKARLLEMEAEDSSSTAVEPGLRPVAGPAPAVTLTDRPASVFIGRIPVLTVDEAKASPKPDFFFVTDPNEAACPGCIKAKALFLDEHCQRWLDQFDVVVVHSITGEDPKVHGFPVWCFASNDHARYKRFAAGNPVMAGKTDLEAFMYRFDYALGYVK